MQVNQLIEIPKHVFRAQRNGYNICEDVLDPQLPAPRLFHLLLNGRRRSSVVFLCLLQDV